MIPPRATITVLVLLAIAIPGTRPWARDDVPWFELSALLEALLLGALILALG
jgi:hypothetical protein